jgi:hypothetical protein
MSCCNAVMQAELFSPPTVVFYCDFSVSASGRLEERGCTCSEPPLSAPFDFEGGVGPQWTVDPSQSLCLRKWNRTEYLSKSALDVSSARDREVQDVCGWRGSTKPTWFTQTFLSVLNAVKNQLSRLTSTRASKHAMRCCEPDRVGTDRLQFSIARGHR